MTPDSWEDTATPHDLRAGKGQSARRTPRPSPLRRFVFWGCLFVALYGLTLFVLNDDWFLLAMPGLIGLAVIGLLTATAILHRPLGDAVPYATDGTDRREPLAYHRKALTMRYGVVLVLVALLVGAFVGAGSDYLVPLAPLAVMTFVFGTYGWINAMVTVSRCARALKVYPFSLRAHVEVLNRTRNGERVVRFRGADGRESPKLISRQLMGKQEYADLPDGAWFAGDDLFGGVLLVPGTGQLAWVRLQDEPAARRAQQSAAPDRRETAQKAGLA